MRYAANQGILMSNKWKYQAFMQYVVLDSIVPTFFIKTSDKASCWLTIFAYSVKYDSW